DLTMRVRVGHAIEVDIHPVGILPANDIPIDGDGVGIAGLGVDDEVATHDGYARRVGHEPAVLEGLDVEAPLPLGAGAGRAAVAGQPVVLVSADDLPHGYLLGADLCVKGRLRIQNSDPRYASPGSIPFPARMRHHFWEFRTKPRLGPTR